MCAAWRVGVVVVWLWPLLAAEVPARAYEGPTGSTVQEPSAAAITAWARAGAVYGGLRVNGVEWVFTAGPAGAGRDPDVPIRSAAQPAAHGLARHRGAVRIAPPAPRRD